MTLKDQFRLVAEHYGCTESERREMWASMKADEANARRCFYLLAEEIERERSVNGTQMVVLREKSQKT